MFALAAPAATSALVALPVAVKAAGELHRHVLASDALARQGVGPVPLPGAAKRAERNRAAGIPGGLADQEPAYLGRVPNRPVTGDLRKDYEVGRLGDATSSKGVLSDILAKVPRKTHGSGDYKKINRPDPRRLPGFDNQMNSL